jgi:hypothetical protein
VIYTYVVIVAVVLFAILGFQRGWLRETASLAGLLVAWLAVLTLGETFVAFANRLFLMTRFTLAGGYDSLSPGVILDSLRREPLIDPRHPDVILGILFLALAVGSFVVVSRIAPEASAASARALGLLVGVANGYLVSYLALRFLVPAARFGLALPLNPGDAVESLGQSLPTLLLAGVVIAIAISLFSSHRVGGKTAPRVSAGRAKG